MDHNILTPTTFINLAEEISAMNIGSPPNRVHEIAQTPYGIRIFSHFTSICYKSLGRIKHDG